MDSIRPRLRCALALALALALVTAPAHGQSFLLPEDMSCYDTSGEANYILRYVEGSGFSCVVDLRTGTSTPVTCDAGQTYYLTNSDSLHVCDPDDSWVSFVSGDRSDEQYLVLGLSSDLTGERQFVPGAGLDATDAGANSTYTLWTASGEEDFLTDAAVSPCGAGTAGSVGVTDGGGPLWYCDDTATPASRLAAYGDTSGNALTGDSATAFFSSGQVESARGGTGIDTSASTGVLRVDAGTWAAGELSGDVATSGSMVTTIQADSVALTTDTTGNYAAGDAEAGNALTGDSATAFFSSGQIEAARGGTGIDSSSSTGLGRADSGTWSHAELSGDVTTSGSNATTIGADKVLESHLKAVDAPSDEECLTYEATGGDFEWQSCGGGGSGDVTDVGPGCSTGACLTDGVATTGSTLLVWEGTSVDLNEFIVTVPSNPALDVTVDLNGTFSLPTAADGELFDLSAINQSSTNEGLKLPQAADISAATAEGLIAWETDVDRIGVGNGTTTSYFHSGNRTSYNFELSTTTKGGSSWTGLSESIIWWYDSATTSRTAAACVQWTLDVACAGQTAELRWDNKTEGNRTVKVSRDASSTWTNVVQCWTQATGFDVENYPTQHSRLQFEARFSATCAGSTLSFTGAPLLVTE